MFQAESDNLCPSHAGVVQSGSTKLYTGLVYALAMLLVLIGTNRPVAADELDDVESAKSELVAEETVEEKTTAVKGDAQKKIARLEAENKRLKDELSQIRNQMRAARPEFRWTAEGRGLGRSRDERADKDERAGKTDRPRAANADPWRRLQAEFARRGSPDRRGGPRAGMGPGGGRGLGMNMGPGRGRGMGSGRGMGPGMARSGRGEGIQHARMARGGGPREMGPQAMGPRGKMGPGRGRPEFGRGGAGFARGGMQRGRGGPAFGRGGQQFARGRQPFGRGGRELAFGRPGGRGFGWGRGFERGGFDRGSRGPAMAHRHGPAGRGRGGAGMHHGRPGHDRHVARGSSRQASPGMHRGPHGRGPHHAARGPHRAGRGPQFAGRGNAAGRGAMGPGTMGRGGPPPHRFAQMRGGPRGERGGPAAQRQRMERGPESDLTKKIQGLEDRLNSLFRLIRSSRDQDPFGDRPAQRK